MLSIRAMLVQKLKIRTIAVISGRKEIGSNFVAVTFFFGPTGRCVERDRKKHHDDQLQTGFLHGSLLF